MADHYATLKIAPDADIEVVRAAYKALMLKYHPDQNRDNPAALAQATRINLAYEILGDPGKRAVYDDGLASARFDPPPPAPEPASAAPPRRPFHDEHQAARERPADRRGPRPSHLRDFLVAAFVWKAVRVAAALAVMAVGGLYLKQELSSMSQTTAQQFSGVSQALGGDAGQLDAAPASTRIIHIEPGQFDHPRPTGPLAWVQARLTAPHYSRQVVGGVAIYRRDDAWAWLEARLRPSTQWVQSPPRTERTDTN